MTFYKIAETLKSSDLNALMEGPEQFVILTSPEDWTKLSPVLGMGIDMDLDLEQLQETKAVVNYDSLTGSFYIPDRKNLDAPGFSFAFALDERGIVIIDGSGYAAGILGEIAKTKKWKLPSLERFFYDFLEMIIEGDVAFLGSKERQLIAIEDSIENNTPREYPKPLNDIRGELTDMRAHYDQLLDLAQELEENENGFFKEENLRYFRLFDERVLRLLETVNSLREYIAQLRDFFQAKIDVRQNRIMTILTIITSIFMPLTLIAGWYGMNFRYMPELSSVWGYPVVIILSVAIVVVSLVYFKKKKWL